MKRRTKYFMMKQFPFLRCAEAVLPIALRPLRWAVCDLRIDRGGVGALGKERFDVFGQTEVFGLTKTVALH